MFNGEDAGSGERPSEPAKIEPLEPGELLRRIEASERRNAELVQQNADLRAELERLRRRQHRQAAPFSKETRVAAPKRPGRKPGQGTFTYRAAPPVEALSEPPIAVPVTELACPHCGGVLVEDGMEVASITDIPAQPRPVVRQYQVAVCHCQSCGRSVRGRHPDLAADQYGATAHRLGPRVLATGHALHYGQGVPQRKVPAVLEALTGARITQGALTQDALWHAQWQGTATNFPTEAALLLARLTDLLWQRTMPDLDNQRLLDDLRRRHAHGDHAALPGRPTHRADKQPRRACIGVQPLSPARSRNVRKISQAPRPSPPLPASLAPSSSAVVRPSTAWSTSFVELRSLPDAVYQVPKTPGRGLRWGDR